MRYYLTISKTIFFEKISNEEANWSGSALLVIKYVNLYQQPGSRNLIGQNLKWVWLFNLFSMASVKSSQLEERFTIREASIICKSENEDRSASKKVVS